jgi:hypothetical protein
MSQQPAPLKDQILRGIREIAEFIGSTPRKTVYLAETGQLPVFKEAGTWIGLKTTLTAHYQKGPEEAAKRREEVLASGEAKKQAAPDPGRKRRRTARRGAPVTGAPVTGAAPTQSNNSEILDSASA